MTEYVIKRSDRKTLAIYITKHGTVEVRCGKRVPESVIREFVKAKEDWINKHLSRIFSQELSTPAVGGKAFYLGAEYPVLEDERKSHFDGAAFYVQKGENVLTELECFYREQAKETIEQLVRARETEMGLFANRVAITSAKTRWGSCSGKKNLNFPWRIMMLPRHLTEYIVVHELAHLKEMNHSKRFWSVVEQYEPDYRDKKTELKRYEKILKQSGWM
ncbi:MAG: SprT family zinc-dependent metalloprotease [Clostridia bacterium]|nr:SprT family zinc-dependent metalloprotease [Clostridia bacterium]